FIAFTIIFNPSKNLSLLHDRNTLPPPLARHSPSVGGGRRPQIAPWAPFAWPHKEASQFLVALCQQYRKLSGYRLHSEHKRRICGAGRDRVGRKAFLQTRGEHRDQEDSTGRQNRRPFSRGNLL